MNLLNCIGCLYTERERERESSEHTYRIQMLVKHPFFNFFTIFLGMLQPDWGRNDTGTKNFVFLFRFVSARFG